MMDSPCTTIPVTWTHKHMIRGQRKGGRGRADSTTIPVIATHKHMTRRREIGGREGGSGGLMAMAMQGSALKAYVAPEMSELQVSIFIPATNVQP